jgi:hypothetical protein
VIAGLTAALAVEGGLVEQDLGGVAGLDGVHRRRHCDDGQHLARAFDAS